MHPRCGLRAKAGTERQDGAVKGAWLWCGPGCVRFRFVLCVVEMEKKRKKRRRGCRQKAVAVEVENPKLWERLGRGLGFQGLEKSKFKAC